MIQPTVPASLQLAPRRLLELPDVAGLRIRCARGALWLTLDHDPRDIILSGGESFQTDEHRRGLLYALEASEVELAAQAQRQPAFMHVQPRLAANPGH